MIWPVRRARHPSGRNCGAAYFCIDVVQHETSADSSVMSMMRRLANENATPVVHVDVVSPGIIEPSMVDRRLIGTPDHAGARKAPTASLLAAMAQSLWPRLAAGGTGENG